MVNVTSKNFFYVSVGQLSGTALQAIFYLTFATLLEPDSYGQMSYFIALAGIFSVVSRFGLHYSAEIYQAKKKSDLANQTNTLSIIITSLAAIILLPINEYVALLSLGISFFTMSQYNLMGLKNYKKFAWTTILRGILVIILPISLYFVLEIPGILIGFAISNFIGCFPFIVILKNNIKSLRGFKHNFKFLFHNFGVDIAISIPWLVDKIIILPILGFFAVGIYQFNLQILMVLEIFPGIIHMFLLSEESSGKSHKRINYFVVSGMTTLVLITIIISPYIINEFFPKFSEGIRSLQILVISIIPLSIASILNAKLQSRESSKIGYSGIVRIISLMGFMLLFGNLYGLIGVSIAVLLSVILYTIFLSVLYYKKNI